MEAHVLVLGLGPRGVAALALALYVVGLVAAFGGRAWLQLRRTGDWGIRRVDPDAAPLDRLGPALFGVSLLATALGLVLGIVAPGWRLPLAPAWTWVGLVVVLAGLAAVMASQLAMGASWRVGVDPAERTELVTDGPFAVVRNPIFSAMGMALAGVVLMVPTQVTLAALVLFVVGVQLQVRVVEEPYLLGVHGQPYRDYARRTGRFLPRLRPRG